MGTGLLSIQPELITALQPFLPGINLSDLSTISAANFATLLAILGSSGPGLGLMAPLLTSSASSTQADAMVGSLPVYIISAGLTPNEVVAFEASLLPHEMEATLRAGAVLTAGDGAMPAHTLLADFGWFAANELPSHTLTGITVLGSVMVGAMELPIFTLDSGAAGQNLLSASNDLPAYILSASGVTGSVGTAALVLPLHRLLGAGYAGALLTAANNLPIYTIVGAGYGPYTLSALNTLPAWQLDAAMSAALAAAYRTWVLNLKKRALTEYTNFSFNSFTTCEGRVFAAGPGGVVELAQQDVDGTAAINVLARTGKHNLGVTYAKRVPRIYLAAATTGALEFRTITGADGRRAYLLGWNATSELQQRRVPIGRGPKSMYWQFELLNREGAKLAVDGLILHPELSVRRVSA